MPRAALFDLDRTLVPTQTGQLYVRYLRLKGEASWLDELKIGYWVVQYTLGIMNAEDVAARVSGTLRNYQERYFAERCEEMVYGFVSPLLTDAARQAVESHRARGEVLAIVTGATRYVAEPIAREFDIPHLVCTELELDERKRFTGNIVEPFCYGEGKIARAQALAREQNFALNEATFYTDSISDLPLLLAVAEPIVVNPDPRLARIARKRGWKILAWR